MMMQQMMQFEAYMPHFSGFSSAEWGSLISGPQHKAAQDYAKDEAGEYGLDCQDYLNIFEQIGVSEKQRSLLAQEFCKSFKIRLAHALESPHGLQFERYDFDADRIVVSIPLSTVRRLVMLFKLVELAPLLHFAPDAGDAEPAWPNALTVWTTRSFAPCWAPAPKAVSKSKSSRIWQALRPVACSISQSTGRSFGR
jgi:hypothetical protein